MGEDKINTVAPALNLIFRQINNHPYILIEFISFISTFIEGTSTLWLIMYVLSTATTCHYMWHV